MSDDHEDDGGKKSSTKAVGDYEVGFGRPPKESQFKEGQSGNPNGRKKKSKSVADQVQSELSRKITVKEAGVAKKISVQTVILRTLSARAAKGEIAAARFLYQLLDTPGHRSTETIDADAMAAEDLAILNGALSSYLETQQLNGGISGNAKPEPDCDLDEGTATAKPNAPPEYQTDAEAKQSKSTKAEKG